MVGFKSIWILSALLIFAACVPQTKQTECKTNEAFNATLRTCVPVMNGPSSFININSFLPTSALTKYKNDATPMTFSVTISNPYAQTYSVVWERIYNGVPIPISPTTPTSYSFPPSLLASELGTHIISVKVKDVSNNIVDSHSFELKINDNPKPIINSASVTPALYSSTYTPSSLPVNFEFTVNNNGATMVGAGYRTDWIVYRSGVPIDTETDNFPTVAPAGSLSSNGFNYPSYTFDPNSIDGISVGSYVIRARVINNTSEIVAEQQWSVTVTHPNLSKVTARDIYSASTSPGFTTVTTAYNGVAYSDYSGDPLDMSFIPLGQTTQGNYCVTVASGDGTYVGDLQHVRVDYYLDGASVIYSTTTSTAPGGNKVCLTDGGPAVWAAMVFNNTTATVTQTHTIVARVTDEATGQEYTLNDMNPSLGTYPITWNFSVKPANAAPTVTFTANANLANITCGTATSTSRTCSVLQDQAFTLGVHAVDDFYSTSSTVDSVQDKFTYTMTLLRNGSPLSTCSKTTLDVSDGNAPGTDYVGPDYLCVFTIPSFDTNGSVDPSSFAYSVQVVFSDVGSPIAGSTGATAATLTYMLNVTETNTAPVIVPQGPTVADSYLASSAAPAVPLSDASDDSGNPNTFLTEGDTLNFSVLIQDAERDDHQINVYLCTDGTSLCSTTALVASQYVTKTDGALDERTLLSYTLPENLIPANTPIGTNVDTFFKILVIDDPDTVAGLSSSTGTVAPIHFNLNVRNKNPAPQFALDATLSPLVTDPIVTMVGYPLTIDPGIVTDASLVATENVISYQWYIDANGGDNSYAAIPGATSRILNWTPSNGILAGTTVNLSLCISDGTVVNPQPALGNIGVAILATNLANGSNCLGSWDVTVKQNAVALNYDGGGANVGTDIAVWQDTTVTNKRVIYSAYNDIAGVIYVEKTVFNADGTIYNNNANGFQTVSFTALDGIAVAPTSIKDISLSGTHSFLYIAYQAATSGSPGSPRIRIRRIDKRSGVVTGSKTDVATHPEPGKFGFRYAQSLPSASQAISTITIGPSATPGQPYEITFGTLSAGDEVTVHGVTFTASDTAPAGGILCSGGALGCTPAGNAALLATAINSSTSRNLQGISAVASGGGLVTIYGDVGGASADLNTTANMANYIPGKLGKIVTYNSGSWSWYLPFVDVATGGSQIRVLSAGAEAGDYLEGTGVVITDNVLYTGIGPVNWFTNEIHNGNMLVGSINTSSVAQLNLYTLVGGAFVSSSTLFSGAPVMSGSLRIAPGVTNNNFHYAAAKVLVSAPSTYDWKIGRYDTSLVPAVAEDSFTNLAYNPATSSVLDIANTADLSIEAFPVSVGSSTEARIVISSNNGGANYNIYAVRYRNDGYLSCDLCVPVTYGTQEHSATRKIATARIDLNMAIGSTNAVPVSRDVLITAYAIDSNSDAAFEPQIGIINARVESMNTTSSDATGATGWRPAFFGSN